MLIIKTLYSILYINCYHIQGTNTQINNSGIRRESVVILTTFSSLASPEVAKMVTCGTAVNPLQWRHNQSNHQPKHYLLNHLVRRRSKKTSKLRITGLCAGNPHKWPVTRKMFPFDDVTMNKTFPFHHINIWRGMIYNGSPKFLICHVFFGLKHRHLHPFNSSYLPIPLHQMICGTSMTKI